MHGEIIAEGLEFPEGPVWVDGVLYCVEIMGGQIARWSGPETLARIAHTGGGPNGATLGPDGALYVTQNGGMRRSGRTTPSIQRVGLDGKVERLVTEISGDVLEGPNDLAFGPDGRLYFTDPRGASDPALNQRPGRIFAWDIERQTGTKLIELGPVFPNGIAFDAEGALVWTESFTRRVMRLQLGEQTGELVPEAPPECVVELPERHFPDGFAIGASGRLYVASTYGHCVSVIEKGKLVDRLVCGDGMITNCCFGGTDLYVTESRHGALWRFSLDEPGLPLH